METKIKFESEFPTRIYYYINKTCNLKCDYCYIKAGLTKDELNFIHIQEFINFIYGKEVELRITGGEPTLHSDFLNIIELLIEKKIKFFLQTNGVWSNEICNYFLSKKNIKLIISPKLFEINGDIENYKRTLKNIEMLKRNRSIYIAINWIVSKKNIKYLKKVYNDFKQLKVHRINFIPLYPVVRNKDELNNVLEDFNENREFQKAIKSITKDYYYNAICLAGLQWCNFEYDSNINAYAIYGCSFVEDVYDRKSIENKFVAGYLEYNKFDKFESLWKNNEAWSIFRLNEIGKCLLKKEIVKNRTA